VNRVKEFRLAHKLTLSELSKQIELSKTALSMIENGHRNPSMKVAFKLADFFGVTIEELFPQQEDTTDSKKPVGV
jgi:putative transcriptional regulator